MSILADRKWLFAILAIQVVALGLILRVRTAPPVAEVPPVAAPVAAPAVKIPRMEEIVTWPAQQPNPRQRELAAYLTKTKEERSRARKWYEENVDARGAHLNDRTLRDEMVRLAQYPDLPANERRDALDSALSLTDDREYAQVTKLWTDKTLPRAMQETLFDDLISRNPRLKLDTALSVAREEESPLAAQAKEFLRFQTQEDHGTDWKAWEDTVERTIREQEDAKASPALTKLSGPVVN